MIYTYSFTEDFIIELYNSNEKSVIIKIINNFFFKKKHLILNQSRESIRKIFDLNHKNIKDKNFIEEFLKRRDQSRNIPFKHITEDESDIIFVGSKKKIENKNKKKLININDLRNYDFLNEENESSSFIKDPPVWFRTSNHENDYNALNKNFKRIIKHCDTIHIIDQHFGKEHVEGIFDYYTKKQNQEQLDGKKKYVSQWQNTFKFFGEISKDHKTRFIVRTTIKEPKGLMEFENPFKYLEKKENKNYEAFKQYLLEILNILKNTKFIFLKFDQKERIFYYRRIMSTYQNSGKDEVVFISTPIGHSTKFIDVDDRLSPMDRQFAQENNRLWDKAVEIFRRIEKLDPALTVP